MNITENAIATILLCSQLGITDQNIQPYTTSEWNILAEQLLNSTVKEPSKLMSMTANDIRDNMNLPQEQADRIFSLLSRGANLAFLLNELEQKSIYVVTRSDSGYPYRLRKALGRKAPPLLYYCGKLELANMDGIAIVGSRNIDMEGEQFARRLTKKAVQEGYGIYSGGAKGVDMISEKSALDDGGYCVSFLADSMTRKIRQPDIRNSLINNKLLLLSAVKPDAPFHAGNAMARNKYIYAMSLCAFVVASDYNKGGTWSGACDSIRNSLVNTYIWDNTRYPGNKRLIAKGGLPISDVEQLSISSLVAAERHMPAEQIDLFAAKDTVGDDQAIQKQENTSSKDESPNESSIYNAVLPILLDCVSEPKSIDEIAIQLNLIKKQISTWIKRAVEENKIRKTPSPTKYIRADR